MVPADDEHTDANKPEETTSEQKTLLDKLKFWKHCKQEDEEPAQLTDMPACLMHWWTPLLVAAILFVPSLILAIIWGGQPHWPSSKAMKLCMTITGAGFAFSAWQQRSHDNAIREEEHTKAQQQFEQDLREREQQRIEKRERYENEREQREQQIRLEQRRYEAERAQREQDRLDKQHQFDKEREERERNRLEQIERDEYWKRREQAYSLLSSNNPNIRLGAIELLIELGDIANKSGNIETAETQDFLQHIVTILCNQVRYEGLNIPADGTPEQHTYLQGEIVQKLLKHIHSSPTSKDLNGWTTCTIDLSNATLNIEIQIDNTTIKQPLILTGATFNKKVSITHSSLFDLHWTNSHFRELHISHSTLKIDSFPREMNNATFTHTSLTSRSNGANSTITLPLTDAKSAPSETNIITFNQDCSFASPLKILAKCGEFAPNFSSERIEFQNCNFSTIEITGNTFNADVRFETCAFKDGLKIHDLSYDLGAVAEHNCEHDGCEWKDVDCEQNWSYGFPNHTTERTAFLLFSNCTFPDETSEKILITGILCYFDAEDYTDDNLISFTNCRTHDDKEIYIEPSRGYLYEGDSYIAKLKS